MQAILPTNFPAYEFKMRTTNGKREVFDPVRKKFVALTPEEFVRQHLIQYLQEKLGYKLSLLSVEKGLTLNGLQKRYDIVAYNTDGVPQMVVECKAPEVKISQAALDQAARYNLKLKVPYLLICNGPHFCCCKVHLESQEVEYLLAIPSYQQL